jgi:hypothetical protein
MSPRVRNRRITYQVQEYSLPIAVSSAVSEHGNTETGVLSTYRHKACEWTGGETREKCISLRLPVRYAIFRLYSTPTVTLCYSYVRLAPLYQMWTRRWDHLSAEGQGHPQSFFLGL